MPLGHYKTPEQHEDIPPTLLINEGGAKAERNQMLREQAAELGPIFDSETAEWVDAEGNRTAHLNRKE
jgi:hypothetical protein